jgi:hypothetical protein
MYRAAIRRNSAYTSGISRSRAALFPSLYSTSNCVTTSGDAIECRLARNYIVVTAHFDRNASITRRNRREKKKWIGYSANEYWLANKAMPSASL